ncbi:hypothetical protein C7M84_022304 [Penaeus vannamei]|uniref:Uncharacterized protein n=1 Tax=Penaeus vannamei TaxID=6689 RepID=A0A3R7QNA0_PENVA|nr:hypothetical protein C7M84_022304 [Penaeus vannamei]
MNGSARVMGDDVSIYTFIFQKIEALSADFREVKDQIQQLQLTVAWHISRHKSKVLESDAESLGDGSSSCSQLSTSHEDEVTVLHHQLLQKDRELEELKQMIYEKEAAPPSDSQQFSHRTCSPARVPPLLCPLQPLPRSLFMTHAFSTSLRQCSEQPGHAPLQQDTSHERPALLVPKDEDQPVQHYPERPSRARDFYASSAIEKSPLRTAPVHRRWCAHHRSITTTLLSAEQQQPIRRKSRSSLGGVCVLIAADQDTSPGSVPFQLASMAELPAPLAKMQQGVTAFGIKPKAPISSLAVVNAAGSSERHPAAPRDDSPAVPGPRTMMTSPGPGAVRVLSRPMSWLSTMMHLVTSSVRMTVFIWDDYRDAPCWSEDFGDSDAEVEHAELPPSIAIAVCEAADMLIRSVL